MNILINKQTNLVEGINSPSTPFTYSIDVEDTFRLTKTVEVQEGEKQKVNEEGQPLYIHEIYRTETHEVITGQEEVLEDTGVPVIIVVQKTDEQGNKLYLESLYNEENQIVDYVEVTNEFDKDGVPNEPIFIETHKKSVKGKPLFYKDIIKVVEEKILDHVEETTEHTIVTEWETITIKTPQITGTEIAIDEVTGEENTVDITEEVESEIQIAKNSITLNPVMIPNMVKKTYDLKSDFDKFTGEEVLQAKYQHILEESQKDYILGDMFIHDNDIDLEDERHSANTGIALLQLLPKGQAKTKTINLAIPTTEFVLLDFVADNGIEVYLSGKKFVNGTLTLATPISNCTIKFVNTTDRHKIIKSYAIGY